MPTLSPKQSVLILQNHIPELREAFRKKASCKKALRRFNKTVNVDVDPDVFVIVVPILLGHKGSLDWCAAKKLLDLMDDPGTRTIPIIG